MSYKIGYNKEHEYIMIVVEDEFTLSTFKELAADVVKFTDRYNCKRILNDMRRANLTETTLDIYNMPKSASQAGIGNRLKRALVVSERSPSFYFLETVFINQGHIVKLFTDIDEALHWLLNKEFSKHEPGD